MLYFGEVPDQASWLGSSSHL